jgi:ABC-2 type transport system permease protein/oleandomycin transport system permease protein
MSIDTARETVPAAAPASRYAPRERVVPSGWSWLWRDSAAEALRHLRAVPRNPDLLVFATIQPIMFVVLFVYVFGGSIDPPGYTNYKQYVVPGIFAQTVVFGSAFTGIGIAEDVTKGFVDRLRSLPMYQSAMLVGRTFSDLMRNLLTFLVMFVVGYAVGFRVEGSIGEAIVATLLLLGFSYSFSWVQALIGLSVKSVEAANSAGFIWMFPLTFVSSAFVVTDTMPDWLAAIADANPFTKLTNATRALYNGKDPGADLWIAIAWAVGITVVFSFLAIRRYSRATSR